MGKRIAIIADWLTNRGGAEHVVEALASAFPEAPVYTSVYNPELFPALQGRLRGTFLQRLPHSLRRKHQWLLPLLPRAFQSLDLSAYDVIISSSSAFSKCLTLQPHQAHICYCHSPTRYLYHAQADYKANYRVPFWMRPLKALAWGPLMAYLRRQDQRGAQSVTHFLANSQYVAQRVRTFYQRDAQVVYPCVPLAPLLSAPKDPQGYFLAVGRFIPYKRFDLLIRTFAANGLPLRLAGIGPELAPCKALAHQLGATNIKFLGFVQRADLPALYANARAFLFPAEEDFGLTPVEAMAAGTPVVYYGQGGATESVAPQCGLPFSAQTPDALQSALTQLESIQFDPAALRQHAQNFSVSVFQSHIQSLVASL